MAVNLVKKLILALNFRGMLLLDKLQKMVAIKNAHAANSTYVPGLSPSTDDVETELENIQNMLDTCDSLEEQLSAERQKIADAVVKVEDTFVNKWASQTQSAAGMNAERAKALGYDIKGEKQPVPPSTESKPVIVKINVNVPGEHTILCRNSLTNKVALPPGILRIDIYGQSGGAQPANLTALIANGGGYLGQATRGKYVNKYNLEKQGQPEYYIAVYIDKANKKPFSQSFVVSAVLT